MASWRIYSKFALVHWSNSIYELIVNSLPCSGYYGLVSSILASICSDVNSLFTGEEGESSSCGHGGKRSSETLFHTTSLLLPSVANRAALSATLCLRASRCLSICRRGFVLLSIVSFSCHWSSVSALLIVEKNTSQASRGRTWLALGS